MANAKKKTKTMLSSFSIILILIFGLGILSHLLPNAKFVGDTIVNGSGTVGATLSQVLMAPILGFENAVDVGIFIMVLGGMLAVVNKTGALETGIKVLVHKLKGKEIWFLCITGCNNDDCWNGSFSWFCNCVTWSRNWLFRFNC